MADAGEDCFSQRGWSNIKAIMPKIKGAIEERKSKETSNIDLSTAENWLIREELKEICKDAIVGSLTQQHFSYSRGFSGDPDLLEAYANFFNNYFNPFTPVLPAHISTAPGASGCIDALLCNICDPGDAVLIPGPYWSGFDFGIRVGSAVTPVAVPLQSFHSSFSCDLPLALEESMSNAPCPVKALLITNPHNPLALCYPRETLEDCVRFCKKHRIHLISDEVYALSQFDNLEIDTPTPFTSVLSVDVPHIGDPSRVHVVWSTSKDLGQSGIRMGCTVTQANEEMTIGLTLSSMYKTSALSTIFVTSLLNSSKLPNLITQNSGRLASAYQKLTALFKKYGVPYIPCNAGVYVFAKLASAAETWEDENTMVAKLKQAGVIVSSGRGYHGPEHEKGWARVGFAVTPSDLDISIQRIESVLKQEGAGLKEASEIEL
ncbi:1-aminocyclopropane-1-carboxylate synthase 7 [Clohesyomyces aquaticus]|uniref:1-aminocyclopropane-1-carboxylate synthase 7 n=1 Tax=Clohesyomyces aquaticus TaxID=1231657 RepID=A0A1Y1ZWU0_9PLEO|nr:1-aminocyclopropane-1-carboxylate synthase 7 [Clohesyomyces aquaticus]